MSRFRLLAAPLAALLLLLAAAPASAVYHPTLGRFLQRDPIGYADGMSLYEYGRSGPCARRDPLGLSSAPKAKVRLHVEKTTVHGTVEAYRTGKLEDLPWHKRLLYRAVRPFVRLGEDTGARDRLDLFAVPDEWDDDPHFPWLSRLIQKYTIIGYGSRSRYGGVNLDENQGDTWWWAVLSQWTRSARGWEMQMSADYGWSFKVENICCLSRRVEVISRTKCPPGQHCNVPQAATYRIDVGESKEIGTAVMGAAWSHVHGEETFRHRLSSAYVGVKCLWE